MKVKTAVERIEDAINHNGFVEAMAMLNKYRRKFGNRKFTYWLRLMVKNGLWETGVKV
jgi:hypothetical protein